MTTMKFPTPKKLRGPGIAAVGYLGVVLAAALLVISLKVGQFAELPKWICWLPMLLGLAGAAAGFGVGVGGIAIAWASIGTGEVNIDWIVSKLSQLQWRRPARLLKLAIVCIAGAAIFYAIAPFGFGLGLQLSGIFFLAAVTLIYLWAVAKLWGFLVSELVRLSM